MATHAANHSLPGPASRRQGGGFALLSNAFLDELRARTLLSGLIRRSVKLQKAGNEWKACCPFHNEKSPSFYVNDDKRFYHCFGCGVHGDAIRWMTDQRGLPFIDAVKELADAAGLEMPAPDPAARERAERAASLHDVNAAAAEWFAGRLAAAEGAQARAYLERRGFARETIAEFGLGYAPPGRRGLADALSRFPVDMLVDAGMLIRPDGGGEPYDRFRGRVMIPIADSRGRVIGFGGRILGDGEPKYLNSPETPLFDKGSTLWNLHRAAPASRRTGRLIVVEGYLDAIALHQAGIREVVAPLGTALTERQMERAWALVDTPLLCLDGDSAGQKAALRAAERALPVLRPGKSLAFATLPAGMDPDDVIRSGGEAAFEQAIAHPTAMIELLYTRERDAGDMAQPEQRAALRARLDALAESCADKVMAQEYRRSFTDRFFEDFGWKRGDRKTLRADILHTAAAARPDVPRAIARSLLYGLMRSPQVLRARVDQIMLLPMADRRLARWRDTLVEMVHRGDTLDGDGIVSILQADGLPESACFNLQKDVRFAFHDGRVDEERRAAILEGLIAFLCEERELDEGLTGLDRAAVQDAAGAGYLAIEAERQYLRGQKASLQTRGWQLGTDEQD